MQAIAFGGPFLHRVLLAVTSERKYATFISNSGYSGWEFCCRWECSLAGQVVFMHRHN
jgi:hypothetical protein